MSARPRVRVLFYGTPDFALPTLEALLAGHEVVGAFGQILPRPVLDVPRRGSINVHAALLPRYRGAAPIAWAIIRGEGETGVPTFQMDPGMDTGEILLQERTPIASQETAGELAARLSRLGATVLLGTLERLGWLTPTPQDHAAGPSASPPALASCSRSKCSPRTAGPCRGTISSAAPVSPPAPASATSVHQRRPDERRRREEAEPQPGILHIQATRMTPILRAGPVSQARFEALGILVRVEADRAFADIALESALEKAALEPRDAALCTEIVYGALRWQRHLDWRLGPHLHRPLTKLDPWARALP